MRPGGGIVSKSGGQLVEQIIHMVDLMRYLMGDAISVYSRQENLFHRDVADYTVEDVSATVFGFQSGAIGVIYATNGAIPGKMDQRLPACLPKANRGIHQRQQCLVSFHRRNPGPHRDD